MEGVSIIICCYNSEKLLPETLKHISMQKVDNDLKWELIIVNNNASDRTKEVACEEWNKYIHNENCSFKLVDEPNPGLSYARRKGLDNSTYDILIYCDDDNWLCENYVQIAYESMQNEQIAVIGGYGEPVFENDYEPEWFRYSAPVYALGSQNPEINKYVYGAGMVIRKKYLIKLYNDGFTNLLTDRNGADLSSGGDTELCYALILKGYDIGYNPDLKFKHFLIKKRLNYEYLKKMHIGFAKANIILSIYIYHIFKKNKNSALMTIFYFSRSIILFFYHQVNPKYKHKKILRIYDWVIIKEWIKNMTLINSYNEKIKLIIK
jgi:glycosyltransferase involved in cell wall biosynthesis